MKSEFGNQQRMQEQRHYEQMMVREREMQLKLEEERRRLETDFCLREKAIEDRTKDLLRQTNEKFHQEDDMRRRETEEIMRQRIREEKQTIESEFNDHRTRLERQIAVERTHERQLVETTKRERAQAEERANTELARARVLEQELGDAKKALIELRARKDELSLKTSDYDQLRLEAERARAVDLENRQLRDMRRDYEIKITNLNDRNSDLERTIQGLKIQIGEND